MDDFFDDYSDEELFGDDREKNKNDDKVEQNKENNADESLKNVWEKAEEETANKKKREFKPRPKLREKELIAPKGMPALMALFADYKPPANSKANPYELMNDVLDKMEYWGHGLFPRLRLEDLLDKVERLGRKRLVQASLRKLRLGMPLDDMLITTADDDENQTERKTGDEAIGKSKTAEQLFDEQFHSDFYDDDDFLSAVMDSNTNSGPNGDVPMTQKSSMSYGQRKKLNADDSRARQPSSDEDSLDDDEEFETQLRNIFGPRDMAQLPSEDEEKKEKPTRRSSSELRASSSRVAPMSPAEDALSYSRFNSISSPSPEGDEGLELGLADLESTTRTRSAIDVDVDSDDEKCVAKRDNAQAETAELSPIDEPQRIRPRREAIASEGEEDEDVMNNAPKRKRGRLNAALWSDEE